MESTFSRDHAEEMLRTLEQAAADGDANWRALHAMEAATECLIHQTVLMAELLEEVRKIAAAMQKKP
jgi:hypothetical protein